MRRLALLLLLVLAPPAAAHAPPFVHAHRGGPQQLGKPAFAEETMPAFRDAWVVQQAVLELDVKLTSDDVPVVIHDATLDRTTPCEGEVAARPWAEIHAQCPADLLGVEPHPTAKASPPVPLSRLAEVLDYAKVTGAHLNVEIKNVPTDPDFDAGNDYASTVMEEIVKSELPLEQLIVQSFWPPNLDVAEQMLPGVETALLTQTSLGNDGGAEFSAGRGYEWWSPQWPVSPSQIASAHRLGVKVVPWTVDTPDAVKAVKAAGADAVITNDPLMARQALGLTGGAVAPPPAAKPAPRAKQRYCRSVRGARRIRATVGVGSCRAVQKLVRAYLRRGCPRRWRCRGRTRVTLVSRRGTIEFQRRR